MPSYDEVIVVRKTVATSGPPAVGAMTMPPASAIEVSIESAGSAIAEIASGSSRIVSVLQNAPTQLIAPLASAGTASAPSASSATSTWGISSIGADTSIFTGSGVTVAVLDTGIDAAHPAFAGLQIVQQDFTGEGNFDGHGHGTHVAGTIAGSPVGGQRIGVAPGISRLLVAKVLDSFGSGELTWLVKGINWALDEGADIISMSLGFDFPGYVHYLINIVGLPANVATSIALKVYRQVIHTFDLIGEMATPLSAAAAPRTAILVAAAGNENIVGVVPEYEIGVAVPASASQFVSVGALGQSASDPALLEAASFSNTGPVVAGPGVDVVSAQAGGSLIAYSGTSMATPHVAGAAALWAEKIMIQTGALDKRVLLSRLIGNASQSTLSPGYDPTDVGAGLVLVPQN